MSGYSLDANILIDALLDHRPAYREMTRIAESGARMWISRIAWIEALSKGRSEEHTSELQSILRTSYAVICLKIKLQNLKSSSLKSIQYTVMYLMSATLTT